MNKKKNIAKKNFIMSFISLVVCVAMLIGTTFAWFTDSVTSGKNQIVAGNLDIEVTHTSRVQTREEKIDGQTDLFKDVTLWEPGAVSYENITVKNVGNLAAKVKLEVKDVAKNSLDGHDLTEVIKVALVEDGFNPTGTTDEEKRAEAQQLTYNTLSDFGIVANLAAGSAKTYGLVLYWAPNSSDIDNLYNVNNGKNATTEGGFDAKALGIEFGINVFATQDTVETDSFDNQYDSEAANSVVASALAIKTTDNTFKTNLTPLGSGETTVEFLVPEGTDFNANTLEVETHNLVAAGESFTVSAEDAAAVAAIDLTVKNENGDTIFESDRGEDGITSKITTKIAPGLNGVSLSYDGEAWQSVNTANDVNSDKKFYYNINDGTLVFITSHYSNYIVKSTDTAYNTTTQKGYSTLKNAIDALTEDGQTIRMLRDVVAEGMSVDNKITFTVDFGGYTYSLNKPGAGSTNTETNGFQLLKGDGIHTITFKNGTINCSEDNLIYVSGIKNIQRLIQNYANLTLEDMTIDGTNQYAGSSYIMSFNDGTVELKGKTNVITASDDVVAFDSCYWSPYYQPHTVILNTTGTINGVVNVNGGSTDYIMLKVMRGTYKVSISDPMTNANVEVDSGATIIPSTIE